MRRNDAREAESEELGSDALPEAESESDLEEPRKVAAKAAEVGQGKSDREAKAKAKEARMEGTEAVVDKPPKKVKKAKAEKTVVASNGPTGVHGATSKAANPRKRNRAEDETQADAMTETEVEPVKPNKTRRRSSRAAADGSK